MWCLCNMSTNGLCSTLIWCRLILMTLNRLGLNLHALLHSILGLVMFDSDGPFSFSYWWNGLCDLLKMSKHFPHTHTLSPTSPTNVCANVIYNSSPSTAGHKSPRKWQAFIKFNSTAKTYCTLYNRLALMRRNQSSRSHPELYRPQCGIEM